MKIAQGNMIFTGFGGLARKSSSEEVIVLIKKDEREYSVMELSNEWKVERKLGGVTVEYRIPKDAAPDAAAVERYIAENNEIF